MNTSVTERYGCDYPNTLHKNKFSTDSSTECGKQEMPELSGSEFSLQPSALWQVHIALPTLSGRILSWPIDNNCYR